MRADMKFPAVVFMDAGVCVREEFLLIWGMVATYLIGLLCTCFYF